MKNPVDICNAMMKETSPATGCQQCRDLCEILPCEAEIPSHIPNEQIYRYIRLEKENESKVL